MSKETTQRNRQARKELAIAYYANLRRHALLNAAKDAGYDIARQLFSYANGADSALANDFAEFTQLHGRA